MRRRQFIAGLGSVTAWPLAARAQPRNVAVIGYLDAGSESARAPFTAAFHRGLGERGYFEGRNVEIVYRWAGSRYDQLPALAADLVFRQVAVIHAQSTPAALAAKSATATIPVVFSLGSDPISLGLVASLNRPGGNVTGVTFLAQDLTAKRLALLHEIVPAVTSIGLLANPSGPQTEAEVQEAQSAARILGVRLTILNATTPTEIDAAFAILIGQGIAALLVGVDTLFVEQRDQLARLVARSGARDLPLPRFRRRRRPDQLRAELARCMARGRHLCRPHPEWREARRSAGATVNTHRDCPQSQDREIAGHRDADTDFAACRRSDRSGSLIVRSGSIASIREAYLMSAPLLIAASYHRRRMGPQQTPRRIAAARPPVRACKALRPDDSKSERLPLLSVCKQRVNIRRIHAPTPG